MNYYDILGVNSDASFEDIATAFRTLAKKYHPDLNKDHNSHIIFVNITEAYEILRDPNKRKAYNILVNESKNSETIFDDLYGDEKIYHARSKNTVKQATADFIRIGKKLLKLLSVTLLSLFCIIIIIAVISGIIAGFAYLVNTIAVLLNSIL